MEEEFYKKNVFTGDLMFTGPNNPRYGPNFVGWSTGSTSTHVAICVWVLSQELVKITTENVHELFKIKYEPGAQLYVFDVGRRLRLITIEKLKSMSGRFIHRGVKFTDENLHLNTFKKFFIEYKDIGVSFTIPQHISCFFSPASSQYDYIYENESCVSFVILWLHMIGYHPSQKEVTQNSRHFYIPDHLRVKYNKSDILSEKETVLYSDLKPVSDFAYAVIVLTIIFLIVTLLFTIRPWYLAITYTVFIALLSRQLVL